MKKFMESKYSFMMISSIIAVFLASIEYITIAFATKYSFIPMLISITIFIGLFIYAFVFKKKQSKYNLLILLFIVVWAVTLFYMGISNVVVGDSWVTVAQDKISIIEFKFPGILEEVQYQYNSATKAVGSVVRKQFKGIDLNLIVAFVLYIVNCIVFIVKGRKEEPQEVVELQPSNSLRESPYFLMTLVSLVGCILSSIECVLLTFSSTAALIMMVVGTVIFIGIFIYILASNKKKTLYNFIIVTFILLWAFYAGKYLALSMSQTNNGHIYHQLGFVFPCIITRSSFDSITHIKLTTHFSYGYINWLFSLGMLVVTSSILYFKEKNLFKKTNKD